jgi:hypothetical protein
VELTRIQFLCQVLGLGVVSWSNLLNESYKLNYYDFPYFSVDSIWITQLLLVLFISKKSGVGGKNLTTLKEEGMWNS